MEPAHLVIEAAALCRVAPLNIIHRIKVALVTKRLKDLMPTAPLAISVSDPLSAMIVAALSFLSTPAGQNLCGDLRTVIVDIVNHVHGQLPKAA